MRPLIGITTCEYPEYAGKKIRDAYIRWIEAAGGLPMLIPASNPAMAAKYAAAADGILFIGGGDVAPEHFGELPEPVPFDAEPKRDAFELALAKAAWEADIPMMGICRGMQVINISLGGSIYQDREYAGFNRIDHRQHWDMKEGAHPIRIIDDRLAAITGSDTKIETNSFGMSNVEIAIRFRRETGLYTITVLAFAEVFFHYLFNEVQTFLFCHFVCIHFTHIDIVFLHF